MFLPTVPIWSKGLPGGVLRRVTLPGGQFRAQVIMLFSLAQLPLPIGIAGNASSIWERGLVRLTGRQRVCGEILQVL